jgi:hypothetical protein
MLDRGLIGYGLLAPHEKYRDEGRVNQEPGHVTQNMLNDPRHVSIGSRVRASGRPSKGGTVYGREWEPGPNHLNNPALQKKHYPGHRVKGRPGTPNAQKNYGGIIKSGPPFGSNGRSKTSY